MDVSKIIRGIVNSRGYTITSAITQWDYGYVFVPEFEDMPATYRLDFSNDEHHGTALPVYCGSEGGEVPEELIDTGKDIFVWFFYIGDGFGKSEYKWRIPNKCKPKTEQDEPTPTQQSSIDQLITRSNEAVESAEQSAEDASTSAQSASADAERAEEARTDAQNYATHAEQSATDAYTYALSANAASGTAGNYADVAGGYASQAQASAQAASEKADSITGLTATAATLEAGSSATASYADGVLTLGIPRGADGDDGYSPTASVNKSGKTATITITDKNGTTSVQVSDGEDGTDGISPSVSVTDITGGHRVVITDKDGAKSFDVEDGATGATPNLTIGTVETLEPSESATAIITGTPENPVLNLGIPQGEQGEVTLEDYYKAFPTDTASGSIASFSDGADDIPLKSLVVDINPIQDLSHGDPSPENICPISGWTQVDVNHSDADMINPTTITIDLGQTVYGGKLDVLTGKLVVDMAMVDLGTLRWESGFGGFYSLSIKDVIKAPTRPIDSNLVCSCFKVGNVTASDSVYIQPISTNYAGWIIALPSAFYSSKSEFKSAVTGQMLVYELETPIEIQLTPNEANSILGVNNIFADTGDTHAEYRADTKLYIEKLTQPEEDDMIADSAITSGKFFMVGNTLYRALANIASGATITVGTNAQRVSLSDALNLVNS